MSDQEIGKKEIERMYLHYFFDAYKEATGEKLSIIISNERPDFVCMRPTGSKVGIELSKIMREPGLAFVEQVINRQPYMDLFDVLDFIYVTMQRKIQERTKQDWLYPDNTLLVLQLMDCPLSELEIFLDESLSGDFADSGFAEIWLADYSEVDVYGFIELFGLHPLKLWGYYPRPDIFSKPYG